MRACMESWKEIRNKTAFQRLSLKYDIGIDAVYSEISIFVQYASYQVRNESLIRSSVTFENLVVVRDWCKMNFSWGKSVSSSLFIINFEESHSRKYLLD